MLSKSPDERRVWLCLSVFLSLLSQTSPVYADGASLHIGGGAGVNVAITRWDMQERGDGNDAPRTIGSVLFVRSTADIVRRFGVEGKVAWVASKSQQGDMFNALGYRLGGLVSFFPKSRVLDRLFIVVGGGGYSRLWRQDTDFAVDYGVGVARRLFGIPFRLEVRHMLGDGVGDGKVAHNLQMLLSVSWRVWEQPRQAVPLYRPVPEERPIPATQQSPASQPKQEPPAEGECSKEGGAEGGACPRKAILTQTNIEITENIYFDTGSARISERSYGLLDQVADILAKNPQVTRVRIEGHTDDIGEHEANMRLSRERADAVMQYLVRKAVAPQRLESRGFGATKPICTEIRDLLRDPAANVQSIESCRAKNRRVEFRILEIDRQATQAAEGAKGKAAEPKEGR